MLGPSAGSKEPWHAGTAGTGVSGCPQPSTQQSGGIRTPQNGIFLSSLCSGHKEQAGHRQGAGRAPHGSTNHSPHLLCLEACLVPAPCPPCLWSPQHRGGSRGGCQEPMTPCSHSLQVSLHYARPAEQFLAIRVFPFAEVLIPSPSPITSAVH